MTIPDQIPPAELERMLDEGHPKQAERDDMPTLEFHAWLLVTGKMTGDGAHEWPKIETRPVALVVLVFSLLSGRSG